MRAGRRCEGTWTINGAEIVLRLAGAPAECADAARYTVAVDGHLTFALVNDTCIERRMILDRSESSGIETVVVPAIASRSRPRRAGPLPRCGQHR